MGHKPHPTVQVGATADSEETAFRASEREGNRFQVRDCPHCGRTTVVDTDYDDQRCDWSDTCGELFDLAEASLSDDAYMDGTHLVRRDDIMPNYGRLA